MNKTMSHSSQTTQDKVRQGLAKRYRTERRFRRIGLFSIVISLMFLGALLTNITLKALPTFSESQIRLAVTFDPERLDLNDAPSAEQIDAADYDALIKDALKARFPEVKGRRDKRALKALISSAAPWQLRDQLRAQPDILGSTQTLWVLADDDAALFLSGAVHKDDKGAAGRLKAKQVELLEVLHSAGDTRQRFNLTFFQNGDSREPEQAGILSSLLGSLYTLSVTLVLAFPIGVLAAIYLEEFAPQNRFTDFIEVNINNLAAVPSIVFGLLGAAVLLNLFGFPRSAPLVGGIVLALMTLPTIIIASRAALKAVPPSIRQAALGLGASRLQATFHHTLPLALPGILTGTIIGMAQALGETAPLLMIGMVAFIVDLPQGVTDPSTVLPVQIYLWADSPERAFTSRTSAAILVLLVFLIAMNALAVLLRKRFERRW